MKISEVLLQEFNYEMTNTRRLLEVVPFDNPAWKPHEKATSLIELAAHVAELAVWPFYAVTASELDFHHYTKAPKPASLDELLSFFDKNVAESKTALGSVTGDALQEKWTLRAGDHVIFTLTKLDVIRVWATNHLIHHRGQLTVYLRMLNVRFPGMYGPTADDKM